MIILFRLDRWGRSGADLIASLCELLDLSVGFISLTEALDLTTPSDRAMARILAIFAEFEREILREPVKGGIAQARKKGRGSPSPERRAVQPLGDRRAAWDRPNLGKKESDERLLTLVRWVRQSP